MKTPEISKSYTHLFYLIIVNLILAFFFTLRKHKLTFLLYLILFFFLGVMRYLSFTFIADDNIKNYDNQEITLTGIICQMPKIRQDSAGIYHLTYVVDTKSIKQKEEKTTTGKVYLYQKQKNLDNLAKINDTISATGTIRLIQNYHNPNLVDRELSAQEEGIYATFSIGKQNLKILNTSDKFSLQEFCYQIEQSFLQSMYQVMPENDANMIFAMLFGGYNNIEKDILEAYSITGIIHILSVSGSHISLISLFLLSLGKFLHLPRFLNLILLLIIIIFYTILCGASIPVIRASVMGLLSIIALYLEEKSTAQHLLSIIALILLLFDPLLLFNISFQLSFASTSGLVYLMPILRSKLNKLKLPSLLIDNLALTMSAQIFAFPIIVWYFTSLSLSSLLANLIIIPLLETLIILGLIAFILGFIFPFITKILFIFASLILSISNE
ncbi:ComEC/Rec2 family competence protein, partial [Megamonas funiformis]|uniref:ComEC/Rec2 family competence protein n=1 Tax=Megamonas funiformis TaxID=437897 RepID=UPI003FEF3D21